MPFFQYRVSFNPADTTALQIGDNYIIDKVDGEEQWNRWYQVQIPLRDFIERVGNIENLERVTHIRMWMTGYRQPFTMRFATLELVGNQWRKAEEVGNQGEYRIPFSRSPPSILKRTRTEDRSRVPGSGRCYPLGQPRAAAGSPGQ